MGVLRALRTAELFAFPPTQTVLRALPRARWFPRRAPAHDEDSCGPHAHGNHRQRMAGPATPGAGTGLPAPASAFLLPRVNAMQRRAGSTFAVQGSSPRVPAALVAAAGRRDCAPAADDVSTANQAFTYLMVGGAGVAGAMGAKSTLMNFLGTLSASGDVLALAQVEADLRAIPEGRSVVVKWRGKPIFIRHRTPAEIEAARAVDLAVLRDPQADAERVQRPEWLVMIGICTHLGCVPIADAGDYHGWYCPCQ